MPEDLSASSDPVSDLSTRTDPDMVGSTGLPAWLNVSEASRYFGITRQSLYRKIRKGQVHGAKKVEDQGWLLPLDGLFNAGLRPVTGEDNGLSAPSADVSGLSESSPNAMSARVRQLETDLATLRQQATEAGERAAGWRERALVAEAEASERAQRIDDLRLSLRALAAGPASPQLPPPKPERSHPLPQIDHRPVQRTTTQKRRWPWQR